MRHLEIEESEFIKTCEENILANPCSKATKFLQNLLRETEHWLPSHTMLYIHCDNETTNRIEGFFGSLKNLLEHKLHTLANLVRAVYIRSERLLIQSRTEKRIAVPSVVQGAQIEWGGAGARPAPGRFAQKSPNSEHRWPAPDITS